MITKEWSLRAVTFRAAPTTPILHAPARIAFHHIRDVPAFLQLIPNGIVALLLPLFVKDSDASLDAVGQHHL
jgi:hypothetical protein